MGDPTRAAMLTALMQGEALTAGELARHAGVTPQTASSHLAKLAGGGLVTLRRLGRHHYYALADQSTAAVLESLMALAAQAGHARPRLGPRDQALRLARVCYDHLAGDLGVRLLDGLLERGFVASAGEALLLTDRGRAWTESFGIDLDALRRGPVCRRCLDWSVRRSHLAGPLGAALLGRIYALRWASRALRSRAVVFTPRGRSAFDRTFG